MTIAPVGSGSLERRLGVVLVLVVLDLAIGVLLGLRLGGGGLRPAASRCGGLFGVGVILGDDDEFRLVDLVDDIQLDVVVDLVRTGLVIGLRSRCLGGLRRSLRSGLRRRLGGGLLGGSRLRGGLHGRRRLDRLVGGGLRSGVLRAACAGRGLRG